jgi:hypothetical protein
MASTQQQRRIEPAVLTPPSVIGTQQACKRVKSVRRDAPFAARYDHMPLQHKGDAGEHTNIDHVDL